MNLTDKLSSAHTALIVIDIQRDFAAPDGKLALRGRDMAMVEPMLTELQDMIRVAAKAKVFTLYTKQVYDRSKLNALQLEQYDLDDKFVTCDIETNGHEFYKINPAPENVFLKYNFNIFSNPDLLKTLSDKKIKTLVLTGMDTVYCVETAIRNGFDLGFKIVVPEDAVAGNAKHTEMHDRTLELVRKTYGVVTTANKIKEIWNA